MELWTDRSKVFAGTTLKQSDADVFLLGIPYDSGCISTPGQRFAPLEIRIAMENLEPRKKKIYDIGNLIVGPEFSVLRKRLLDTIPRIPGKFICLGGDHSITLPIVEALKPRKVISLDAHCDWRDEYAGSKINAATVMKRVSEICECLVVGVREKFGGNCVTPEQLSNKDLKDCYLSVDIDVLDPSIAPGTGTPVPLGYSIQDLFSILEKSTPIAADIVEVNPLIDRTITPTTAAYILYKLIERF